MGDGDRCAVKQALISGIEQDTAREGYFIADFLAYFPRYLECAYDAVRQAARPEDTSTTSQSP